MKKIMLGVLCALMVASVAGCNKDVAGKAEIATVVAAFENYAAIAQKNADDCAKFGAEAKAAIAKDKDAVVKAVAVLDKLDDSAEKALADEMKKLDAVMADDAILPKTLAKCAENADVQAFATELTSVLGK